MANHVTNWIRINANPDALEWIKTSIGEGHKEGEELIAAVFKEYPTEYDRGWVTDNCGAKWLYGDADYTDDETVFINITSAWDPVDGWISELAKRLYEIDPETTIRSRFYDEAMNFAGVSFVSKRWDDTEMLTDEERDEFCRLSEIEDSDGDEWQYLDDVFQRISDGQDLAYDEVKAEEDDNE
jgi:hypothetical protein